MINLTLPQVALGGAIGASLRYLTNVGAMRAVRARLSLGHADRQRRSALSLMGVLVVVLAQKGGMRFAPFLMTGILGGFTTFSAFSLDTLTLCERGQTGLAAAYVAGSVALSLAGIVLAPDLTRGAFA